MQRASAIIYQGSVTKTTLWDWGMPWGLAESALHPEEDNFVVMLPDDVNVPTVAMGAKIRVC